jgi:alpha-mannosidase
VLAGGVAAYHEGVFEYEVADRGLLITLLRCVGTISRDRLATRPWPAGPDVPTPDAQLLGTTSFSIGLRAGALAGDLPADWERFALPVRSTPARGGGTLPDRGSLLRVGGDAVLSSVRRREGGVEVRLWNPRADRAATARIGDRSMEIGPARIETLPVPSR